MFRWLAVLCVGLYAAMLIGGQDRGQVRLGLISVKAETQDAFTVAQGAQPAADNQEQEMQVISAAFAPEKPLMVSPTPVLDAVVVAEPVLEQPAPDALEGRIFYVDAPSVNVRQGPGTGHPVIDSLPRGETVLVLVEGEGRDGWSLVRIEGDGVEGYVASRFLVE